MNIRVVWVDMDDTICDFMGEFRKVDKESNIKKIFKSLFHDIFIKMLGFISKPSTIFHQSRWGFFRNLKPIPGAITGINELKRCGFDVRILTRPSIKNPLCYTEKREWVEKHLGEEMCEKLWLSPDKTEEVKENDILIDDKVWNVKGEQIIFGKKPFESWDKVVTYIKNKK